MTKIKFCGLKSLDDICYANELLPEYVGFVFVPKSKRYITPAQAEKLRAALSEKICAVGVFVNENLANVAELLNAGIIDAAQLHGNEDDNYVKNLRGLTKKIIIQAFQSNNIAAAEKSLADFILIDSGAGGGKVFDWNLIKNLRREYFLAGGLNPENVGDAIKILNPFAVDVSSGIETDGRKDFTKMATFAEVVRRENL
ncbi:MAG: phosphoribosylanthranilate isomerase [Selenomonadaceae bacterium]|nr:phosphoribosylanthranilate isomerase [Selenomonadaceae bacterium]